MSHRLLLILGVLLLLGFMNTSCSSEAESGAAQLAELRQTGPYDIKIKINGLSQTEVYLANHKGDKQYWADTFAVDPNGNVHILQDSLKRGEGFYMIIIPDMGNKYFELILAERDIEVETDTSHFILNMQVKKSIENKAFYEDMQHRVTSNRRKKALREELKDLDINGEEGRKLADEIDAIDEDLVAKNTEMIEKYPHLLYGKFLKSVRDIDVPETPKAHKDDSTWQYRYYKAHYWDDFHFEDDRLAISPAFHNKLSRYFNKVIVQDFDSMKVAIDFVLEKTKDSPNLYRYAVEWFEKQAKKNKYMGMDVVLAHLYKNYHAKGKISWIDSAEVYRKIDRVRTLERLHLGKVAPNVTVSDKDGVPRSLHGVDSKYTLLYIWSPDCEHCKVVTPKLGRMYSQYKERDIEIFAIATEEKEKWIPFIDRYNLDWINVFPTSGKEYNFISYYDVTSTPKTYLLDEEKKIIAKALSIEQYLKFLDDRKAKGEE